MMLSTSELYQICMKIYENVSVPVSWFVLPLFLIRVSVAQLSGDSAEIRAALKGLVMYFVLILSFGMILDLLLQIPQSFIPDVTTEEIAAKTRQIIQQEQSTWDIVKKSTPELISFVGECLLAVIYWAMVVLHVLVMVLMTAMAPVIFLLSCVGNIGVPVRVFFGLIIMSSCWPALWYGFDQALPYIEKVIPNDFGKLVLAIVLNLFKGIGPFAIAYMSLNSGPGKAAVTAVSHMLNLTQKSAGKVGEAVSGSATYAAKTGYNKFQSLRTQGAANLANNEGLSRTSEALNQDNISLTDQSQQEVAGPSHNTTSSRTQENSSTQIPTVAKSSESVSNTRNTATPESIAATTHKTPSAVIASDNEPTQSQLPQNINKPSSGTQNRIQNSQQYNLEKGHFKTHQMDFAQSNNMHRQPKIGRPAEINNNGEV